MNNILVKQLQSVLKSRGFEDTYDETYLEFEVKQAIAVINRCRRFTPKDDALYDKKYEYLIIPMCVSAIAKMGAEGQTSHTENSIVRYYGSASDYPNELITQIIPLVK